MTGGAGTTPSHPDVRLAADHLRTRLGFRPEVLIVLGSGILVEPDAVQDPVDLPFEEIPGFPPAGVMGHPGRYLAGRMEGVPVLVQRGRFHHYEGHPAGTVALPVRVAAAIGVSRVILTNATGGIRPDLEPGSVMLIEDHLNLQGRNPLVGPAREGEERFPDMSRPWDREWIDQAVEVGMEVGVPLARGCYGAVLGPNFETPAEVRALRMMGADVVGMSTVPEVLVARASGMRALGISLVVNPGSGLGGGPLDHEEVLATSRAGAGAVMKLIRGLMRRLDRSRQMGGTDAK
jgi:purine-nucleoside phosphorylase